MKHSEAFINSDYKPNKNNWFTKGIKTSCNKKRDLYLLYRNDKNNAQIKDHYKKYSSILKEVINEAKKQYFHNQTVASSNKVKAIWKIIKKKLGTPSLMT